VPADGSIAGSYKTAHSCRFNVDGVEQIAALVGFSIISVITPGPNNLMLWTTGTEFGFPRAMPHILGTAVGIGGMALAAVVGVAALVAVVPGLALAMKIAGSLYLLYLAWQVAGAGVLSRTTDARPLSFIQGAAFQLINPKSWTFALSAVTTFRPAELSSLAGGAVVAMVMMIVIVPASAVWALGGGLISRWLADDRSRRIVSVVMAVLLAATVVSIWL
jgi:threonine/homoserine/homoserine lactone efflux protein